MIIDTLVVVVCLMVDTPKQNRFARDFQRADSVFEQASANAMQSACERTKKERDKLLSVPDMRMIVDELKRNTVKP